MDVWLYLAHGYLGAGRRWRAERGPPLWQTKLSKRIQVAPNTEQEEETRARGPSSLDRPLVDVGDDAAPDDDDDDQQQQEQIGCDF